MPKWQPKVIDIVTNVLAVIACANAVLHAALAYFTSQPFDPQTFGLSLLGAIIGYFTGKSGVAALKQLPPK